MAVPGYISRSWLAGALSSWHHAMNDTLPCRPQERDLLARSVFVLIGVACLALGCGALAQGNEPPTGSEGGATTGPMLATELLAALDADDVDERAEAADAILRDDSISDESIYYTLTEADFLTPEQHAWLLRIAEGRRFYEPGVIGIWMDTNRQQMGPGVGVARVMEAKIWQPFAVWQQRSDI